MACQPWRELRSIRTPTSPQRRHGNFRLSSFLNSNSASLYHLNCRYFPTFVQCNAREDEIDSGGEIMSRFDFLARITFLANHTVLHSIYCCYFPSKLKNRRTILFKSMIIMTGVRHIKQILEWSERDSCFFSCYANFPPFPIKPAPAWSYTKETWFHLIVFIHYIII